MLEGKNNAFPPFWEIRSIFMQNCFIVSALQHGCSENPLYKERTERPSEPPPPPPPLPLPLPPPPQTTATTTAAAAAAAAAAATTTATAAAAAATTTATWEKVKTCSVG